MDWENQKFLLSNTLGLWSDAGVELPENLETAVQTRGIFQEAAPHQAETPAPTPWTITGPSDAPLVFVEVAAGSPFDGEPGELFDRILGAMKLTRAGVRLVALGGESLPQLDGAKVVVACGAGAAARFFGPDCDVSRQRGALHSALGMQVMATHHPSQLIEAPDLKKEVWQDMKIVLKKLGR